MSFNNMFFSSDFFPLFSALCIVFLLSTMLITLSLFLGKGPVDPEKLSAYECGFNPFEDARNTFDIRFYLVAVLFILFDVEVALLIPVIFILFILPTFSLAFFFSFLSF